jgi:hypothetical protein
VTTFEGRFLRPVLRAWSVLAAILIVGIAADVLAPPALRPLRRFLSYHDNLRAVEWTASEQARAQLPPCRRVLVDTDDRLFFYNLRYRSYPTWILTDRDARALPPESPTGPRDSLACRVYYHERVLRVEEARVE